MRLEQRTAYLLTRWKKSLALAESCSGGLLANRLTDVPGSSKFFEGGVIAYSNEVKSGLLKVPQTFIHEYGAVSATVAERMAQNVKKLFKTDFGISITGIAGPSGGTKTKPVGLTFICVSDRKKTLCRKFLFKGSRAAIKFQATTQALKILLEFL